ncbi:MAG: hypothetical protein AB1753_01365 [Thermoproteota archaeon]
MHLNRIARVEVLSEKLKFKQLSSKLIMDEKKLSRKVVEAYERSKDQKIAFIKDSDFNLLGLNQQQDCLLITGKRKISAWAFLDTQIVQDAIRLAVLIRNFADVSIGDIVTIEKVTPVAGERVILKPIEEIIPGISSRIVEYIPFSMKENPLVIGERVWYTFDGTMFVFDVVGIRPQNAGAILVTKDTRFEIEQRSSS